MIKKTKRIAGAFYRLLIEQDKPSFQQERLDICAKCDERAGPICGNCGCFLRAKTILEEEECPIGKWHEIKEADPK